MDVGTTTMTMTPTRFCFVGLVLLLCIADDAIGVRFASQRESHQAQQLNRKQIQYVSSLSNSSNMERLLDNVLVPRVVGTASHQRVEEFIHGELEANGFAIEVDQFDADTPLFGRLTFRNIIGVLNPNAERYLVLACHYDSKYFKVGEFVGATDSAVPCAMMLDLIATMRRELAAIADRDDVSLMLVFFDGEEAFHQWSDTDSIYGARNLAAKWDGHVIQRKSGAPRVSTLERIDVLVLLDLLGAPRPKFYSYFRQTDRQYLLLSRAEDALHQAGALTAHGRKYFRESASNSFVEDDHVPFLRKGVPILHVIPSSFPDVWHTLTDNRDALDANTITNLNKILRVFVAEYLHLPIRSNSEADDSSLHEEF